MEILDLKKYNNPSKKLACNKIAVTKGRISALAGGPQKLSNLTTE